MFTTTYSYARMRFLKLSALISISSLGLVPAAVVSAAEEAVASSPVVELQEVRPLAAGAEECFSLGGYIPPGLQCYPGSVRIGTVAFANGVLRPCCEMLR